MENNFPPIGTLHTCFREKFGTPRQARMIPEARGILKLNPDPAFALAVQELESFSHVWLIYVFHRHREQPWRPLVHPPRVETKKVGVFASRSPHRPNPLGMSALKLEKADKHAPGGIEIHLSGVDILDGTPVLDIKPYLPYADQIAGANSGWANAELENYPVDFSPESREKAERSEPTLLPLLARMLSWDPRPTSQRKAMPLSSAETQGKIFRFRLGRFDVEWQMRPQGIYVLDLHDL